MRLSFRLWARLLLALDRLLGTHLVAWELDRRQLKIDQLLAGLAAVNRDLDNLGEELEFNRLVFCLIGLKARSERDDIDDWLRFAPHCDGEEALLDSAIEYLVKPRLARIDVVPAGSGQFIYRLDPDWGAIATLSRDRAVASELLSWLEGPNVGM